MTYYGLHTNQQGLRRSFGVWVLHTYYENNHLFT